jgi:hypothetical protein
MILQVNLRSFFWPALTLMLKTVLYVIFFSLIIYILSGQNKSLTTMVLLYSSMLLSILYLVLPSTFSIGEPSLCPFRQTSINPFRDPGH